MDVDLAKHITDLRHNSFEKFNNIVVSVSSGALALTIAFRDKFKAGSEFSSALFTCVWVLFILCVLLGTFQSLKGAYIAEEAVKVGLIQEIRLPVIPVGTKIHHIVDAQPRPGS